MVLSHILNERWTLQEALKPEKMEYRLFVAIIRARLLSSETIRTPKILTVSSKFYEIKWYKK